MTESAGAIYLRESTAEFRKTKSQVEKAVGQVNDDEYFATIDPETNSIAVIVKHLAGNLRSRWLDFLTSDGEKPDRNRDSEFVIEPGETRSVLTERWEAGWGYLFEALSPLTDQDLTRVVRIRNEPHSIVQAVNRQLTHYSYHAGQIVLLARHFRKNEWKTLSIPRGGSETFNAEMLKKTRGS